MADIPPPPPEKVIEPAEISQSAAQVEMDKKVAEAKPAEPTTVPEVPPGGDNMALKAEVRGQQLDAAAQAEARIVQAGDVSAERSEKVVVGNPEGDKQYTHPQGQNERGYLGTCGLVSCEGVLRKFGVEATESDLVEYASQKGLCTTDAEDPTMNGGTSPGDQAQILTEKGAPAHVETGGNLESLAANVEAGRGTIIEVNARELWHDREYIENGKPNHAVVVTGVERDASSSQINGFYINDSGTGQAGRFIDTDTMLKAWVKPGGVSVVTNNSHS